MLKTLSLILPVLIPSWRFFKTIEPSPRVQWRLLSEGETCDPIWHEFRPRPLVVTPLQMLCRLFWNPAWNDALFVMSCAERIGEHPTPHAINEIQSRILEDLEIAKIDTLHKDMQFRLVFVARVEGRLTKEILFQGERVRIVDTVAP